MTYLITKLVRSLIGHLVDEHGKIMNLKSIISKKTFSIDFRVNDKSLLNPT